MSKKKAVIIEGGVKLVTSYDQPAIPEDTEQNFTVEALQTLKAGCIEQIAKNNEDSSVQTDLIANYDSLISFQETHKDNLGDELPL